MVTDDGDVSPDAMRVIPFSDLLDTIETLGRMMAAGLTRAQDVRLSWSDITGPHRTRRE